MAVEDLTDAIADRQVVGPEQRGRADLVLRRDRAERLARLHLVRIGKSRQGLQIGHLHGWLRGLGLAAGGRKTDFALHLQIDRKRSAHAQLRAAHGRLRYHRAKPARAQNHHQHNR